MQIKIFTVPLQDAERSEAEANKFLLMMANVEKWKSQVVTCERLFRFFFYEAIIPLEFAQVIDHSNFGV